MYKVKNSINRANYGLVSRKDLVNLSNSHFISWCTDILESIGFRSIQLNTYKQDSNFQLRGYINEKLTYIKCAKLDYIDRTKNSLEDDDFLTVGRPDLQKLVGTMEHDNIMLGYVLTTGDFTDDAIEFANTMPDGYFLKIIDGCELTRLYRRNQKQYLASNLE